MIVTETDKEWGQTTHYLFLWKCTALGLFYVLAEGKDRNRGRVSDRHRERRLREKDSKREGDKTVKNVKYMILKDPSCTSYVQIILICVGLRKYSIIG